ncbi:MAG TPA: phosphoribosyltransferase [Cyclobacteriaceae bacterium]|nr:phosphoribosyltransferase [Cyclobacteriaceae bacterium]
MEKVKTNLDFQDISQKLRNFRFPKVDLVIGIATGGTFPAIMIAHQLGLDCRFIHINFRDPSNEPVYPEPVLLSGNINDIPAGTKILLVDEVSVSGKTINKALELLKNFDVKTFVLKGNGDYVLFPDVKTCVNWPWKLIGD